MKHTVILKFGGTSLRDRQGFEKAYQHILNEYNKNHQVICVVSAMGRKGDGYSTDSLKSLINNYVTGQEQDRLLSVGETISSVVFTDFLIHKGLRAYSLATKEIGILTDQQFTNANILGFDDRHLRKVMETYPVVVVPGFQGMTIDGYTTTLGRGGSDTTAIYLGIQLKAKEVKIISDVDGIYSGDPRIIKQAYRYPRITYDQLESMTLNGSKVLHAKAAKLAKKHQVKLIFTHIDSAENYTEVTDEFVPVYNITHRPNYFRYSLKQRMNHPLLIPYLNDYYGSIEDIAIIDTYLQEQGITFKKEPGYCKITVLQDEGKLRTHIAFVESDRLIDTMNMIHDMYLYSR